MSVGSLLYGNNIGIMRGERVLFRDVSLSLSPGEAIVLRGANGAGKTTLLRILAGLTQAETGEVSKQGAHHWIAHREGLKPHETPADHLRLRARAWGQTVEVRQLLADMGLSKPADVPAKYLSAGQRRRTALARLRLEDRPIWLLDEPFTALDADGKSLLQAMISNHRTQGGGVIAAIHGEAGFEFDTQVEI